MGLSVESPNNWSIFLIDCLASSDNSSLKEELSAVQLISFPRCREAYKRRHSVSKQVLPLNAASEMLDISSLMLF